MLARVTDQAIQIYGGMGLMDDLPLARFWRDARVERIWDGTSEIQRTSSAAICSGRSGHSSMLAGFNETPPPTPPHKGEGLNLPHSFRPACRFSNQNAA